MKLQGPLTFILLLLFADAHAQQNANRTIDSLQQAVKKIPDTAKRQKAIAINDIGTAYMHTANYIQAASYYAESLNLATELKDELLMALIYRNMAVLSFNQANSDKVREYHQKALAIYEKRNDKIRKADLLMAMANNMLVNGDTMNARQYYEEAIGVFRQTGNRLAEAMAYSNLSITYNTRYPEKIRLAVEAKNVFDSLPTDNPVPAINTGNLGVAYFDIVRYNHRHLAPPGPLIPATKKELLSLANKYIREAISIAHSKQNVIDEAYFSGLLAELQEYNGDYKNAYYNIRKYFETNDSIFSQENKNQIAALQSKQEMSLKNAEIEQRKLELRSQRTQLLFVTGGAALSLIIGVLLYRQSLLRKKNNEVLKQLNRELATANEVKGKFFAILSHDLRSPVAKLVSFLQYRKLKPGVLTESQVAAHEQRIEHSAQSLLATMESLLLWSKEQMEHFKPKATDVHISSVFEYIKRNFDSEENITFHFSAGEALHVYTDENYLKAILYNLTANAVKAVQTSISPSIEWRAWEEGGEIYLSITDNGPGISADKAAAFFAGTNAGDSRHGLGLHIIRDLAKAINCRLSLGHRQAGMQVVLQLDRAAKDNAVIGR